jgi:hypothetical protein
MSRYWKMAGAILIVTLAIVLAGVTITAAQDEPVTPVDPEPSVQPDIPLPYYWDGGGRFGGGQPSDNGWQSLPES